MAALCSLSLQNGGPPAPLTVPPRDDMFRVKRGYPAGIAALPALALLAACGGGGGSSATAPVKSDVPEPVPAATVPAASSPAPAAPGGPRIFPPHPLARQTPVVSISGELRIGAMPPPEATGLEQTPDHGGATVRYGRVRDGVGADLVTRYLRKDSPLVHRFARPPVVRYVESVTPTHKDEIILAVQFVNGNLPGDFQIKIGSPVSAAEDARLDSSSRVRNGEIVVEYDRREDWEIAGEPNWIGMVAPRTYNGEQLAARIWVDQTRITHPTERMGTLMHELLHALGRDHPDGRYFPETVMNTGRPWDIRKKKYDLMYPLDREALLAVYGRLRTGERPSDIAASLGPWEDQSLHVRGEIGGFAFGAALRNGLVRPWALGPDPAIDLADNTQLTGSVSWAGRLLGLTPGGRTVAGAAGLTVDLTGSAGNLDFTGMEQWTGKPGAPGSGTVWRDGDLNYGITVEGNGFSRSAGADEGVITGSFFGLSHQGMGGTLTRSDLSAGFAGTR